MSLGARRSIRDFLHVVGFHPRGSLVSWEVTVCPFHRCGDRSLGRLHDFAHEVKMRTKFLLNLSGLLVNIFLLVEYTAPNCSLQLKVRSILIHSHNAARVNFLRPKYHQVRSFIKLNHAFWIKFNFTSLPSIIFVLPTSSDSFLGTQSVNSS